MRRKRITLIFLLPLIAILCAGGIFIIAAPFKIPDLAEETFGPVSTELEAFDQIYLSAMVLLEKETLTSPAQLGSPEITFVVELGESPVSVVHRLEEAKIIENSEALRHYLVYSGLDTQIQAGEYRLSPILSPVEIAQMLRDPTPFEVDFSVLAGWRAEEIAASLPTSGLEMDPESFVDAVQDDHAEGFLFPGTYTLPRETSTDLLVRTLVNAFSTAVTPEILAGFAAQGLSTQEAVILASIVEREAVIEDEMPIIASVFLNRLSTGIKLDADPTVQYALGFNPTQNTWWTNPLSKADLDVDSPYNTYRYPGLPPGPICNPGINALRAVAFPAQTPYFYFRASCDGSGRHSFSQTFEEHIGNECP